MPNHPTLMFRITGYGVIAEKPRVRQLGQIIPCFLWEKNYALDQKLTDTVYMQQ